VKVALHITQHRRGFGHGTTEITRFDEADPTGIAMSVVKLDPGDRISEIVAFETAWLLMTGEATATAGAVKAAMIRGSIFDALPYCVHAGAGESVAIEATSAVELLAYRTRNTKPFAPRILRPEDVRNERRGKSALKETSYRYVRTIFDRTNAPEASDLVLGEVINFPGRWSSYPPHHHPQPEIYHYRFTDPRGFGHAELGETVLKVRHNDTVKILAGVDHPQCAAPGYGMYYSWVIRHLEGAPYDVPEFSEEHRWMMKAKTEHWWPSDE
jgi:5-deoxy-glucuronate isomerase